MLVYLFRDENSGDTFAYSADVTGRNIPREQIKHNGVSWRRSELGVALISRKSRET